MNDMNKPTSMLVKETKLKLAKVCNESGLPPIVLDLIMQGIYSEIHYLAERQTMEEETNYFKVMKGSKMSDSVGDGNE